MFHFSAALLTAVLAAGCEGLADERARVEMQRASASPEGGVVQASYVVAKAPPQEAEVIPAGAKSDPRVTAIPIPGSGLVRARSAVTVDASIERVRDVVNSYTKYPEFMPHYKSCRVLGRSASGGRDVYMELRAAGGAVTFWARIDARKPVFADGFETYESRLVEGNVKALEGSVRLKSIDKQKTELTLESFVRPTLPLPDSLLNRQNLDGARDTALAIKARSEGQGGEKK